MDGEQTPAQPRLLGSPVVKAGFARGGCQLLGAISHPLKEFGGALANLLGTPRAPPMPPEFGELCCALPHLMSSSVKEFSEPVEGGSPRNEVEPLTTLRHANLGECAGKEAPRGEVLLGRIPPGPCADQRTEPPPPEYPAVLMDASRSSIEALGLGELPHAGHPS